MNEEEKRKLRHYFSTLPDKDIKRAKGIVESDATKLDVKTFKQRIDEQNAILQGNQKPEFDFTKFFISVAAFFSVLFLIKKF
jgi:hypothetical protein